MSEAVAAAPAQSTNNAGTEAKPESLAVAPAAAEAKPESMTSGEQNPAAAKPDAKPAVPEKYELKMPENALFDQAHLDSIAAYAKENGMTQEQAQKHLEREHSVMEKFMKGQHETVVKTNNAWFEQIKNDKEIGGAALEESGTLAYAAAKQWFGDEFVAVLKKSNLNHFPPLFKGLVKLAKATSDDRIVQTGQTGGKRAIEDIFYPKK